MHLSRYTDYAYRVLMYTAANHKRCTLAEVGDFYGISREHLRKVVHNLGQLNYLRTYKGKAGGIELNLDPSGISLGAIYREFEHVKESVINCRKLECLLTPACKLKAILYDSERAFIAELDKYSLADLIANPATIKLLESAEA